MVFYVDFLMQRVFTESPLAAVVRRIDGHANEIVKEIGTQLQVITKTGGLEEEKSASAAEEAANKVASQQLLDPAVSEEGEEPSPA